MNDDWESLANACALLSTLWLREVDEAFVSQMMDPKLHEAFTSAGGSAPTRDDLDDLAVEYCRLFVGPRDHVPPYQSVWQRGEFQSEAAVSVKKFAEACNFATDESDQPMMDHLGVELAVMAQILYCRRDAADAADAADADALRRETEAMATEFHRRHLHWCRPLLDAVEQRTHVEFYRGLATMTGELIELF